VGGVEREVFIVVSGGWGGGGFVGGGWGFVGVFCWFVCF